MTITGLSGDIGSGKSWKMLQFALEQTNSKQKYLVTNFGLNKKALKLYCAARKQWWNVWMIDHDLYSIVSCLPPEGSKQNVSIVPLFQNRTQSVCVLDEAGIFLNARQFKNCPAQLLMDLAQSRKDGNDLIWASQFDTQVDVQFRNLTQFWIHCDSTTGWDKKERRPSLVWKTYFHFKGAEYERWQRSTKARTSFFRTMFAYAFDTQFGPLSKTDKMLFDCFNSFTRLEKQGANAKELVFPSYKTEAELIASGYYKMSLGSKRRADSKQVKKVVLKPKPVTVCNPQSDFVYLEENSTVLQPVSDVPQEQKLPLQVPKSKLVPIISYSAGEEKHKPSFAVSSLVLPALFVVGVAAFFSLYQFLDSAAQAKPRRVPLAGGAAEVR
jgi:hypothetical protein